MLPIYFLEWWSGQSHDDYAPSTFLSVWRDDMDGCSLLELFPASTETPLWGFPLYVFIWDPSLPFGVSHSTTVSASEWSQDFLTTFSEACFFFFLAKSIHKHVRIFTWFLLHHNFLDFTAKCCISFLMDWWKRMLYLLSLLLLLLLLLYFVLYWQKQNQWSS